jgi:uncharacterized membrane protein YoaK (UPF0700 family)
MATMTEPVGVPVAVDRRAGLVDVLRRVFIDEQDGPLPALLLALTVLAGLLDAISILRLGGVFVATITGNLVFLGLAAAGATGFAVGTSALALGAFLGGVLIGDRACRAARSHRGRALRNVVAIKIWLGCGVSVIAITSGSPFPVGARDAMVVLLAISMGAQLAAIRYCKVPDLVTVVVTMTIAAFLTEHGGGWRDPKLLRRGLAVAAFVIGALSGALIILNVNVIVALLFGLVIMVAVGIAAHLLSRTSPEWSAPRIS